MVQDKRVEVLDSLRAFAALSVCFFHFVCTTTGYFENETVLGIFSVGKYGVQMFFVISGFVIPWSMYHGGYRIRDFFRFFGKRLARLEPPYLFSLLIAVVLLWLRGRLAGDLDSPPLINLSQVVLHLGYLIPLTDSFQWLNPVYWTLAVEFQYYLLMALLYVPLVSSGRIWRWLLYVALCAASFAFSTAFLLFWLPVFLIGILLFLFVTGHIDNQEFYLVLSAVVLFSFYRYPVGSVLYSLLPILALLFWRSKRLPLLDGIGKFSYSIYLVHSLIGAAVVNTLSHTYRTPAQKVLVVILGVAVSLFSAWLMYLLIERPSKRLSSAIKYKQSSDKVEVTKV